MTSQGYLQLADYRRRVHALYAAVRGLYAQDPEAAHAHWRRERDALFRTHPQSALSPGERAAFAGLRYYEYDPDLAFTIPLTPGGAADRAVGEETPTVAGSGAGAGAPFVRAGAVDLPIGRLHVYWLDAYGGGLFLPFRDATSGRTTYGGGRYLLDTVKGADLGTTADGRLILDFNFAYHPSCHYEETWSCPLAPGENWLPGAVSAGERVYDPPALAVQPSGAQGTQLVTLEPIPANAQVASFAGAPRLPQPTRYSIQVSESGHIEDLGLFRNLNHSCAPSVRLDVSTLTVRAVRDLSAGEALTFFYPSTEWHMATPFTCLCGAADCLGTVSGAEDLPLDVLLRYDVSPHVLSLRSAAAAAALR